jgi:hypothetical protein
LKGFRAVPLFRLENKECRGIEEAVEERQISRVVIGFRGRKASALVFC